MKINIKSIIWTWERKKISYWQYVNNKNIFDLFKQTYKNFSGYRDFINKNKRSEKISEVADIPITNKKRLFKKYPISALLPDNELKKNGHIVSVTSGTTSTPTYFLRNEVVDEHHSIITEYFLQNGKKGSILYIDCFSMGVWIAGLINYEAVRRAAQRGTPVSVITPGINKKEIFYAIKELGKSFDTIVLAGYPPFIKDIIDESAENGINLHKLNIRLVFAAESFTETFRDYLVDKCRIADTYKDTMNIYGSVELGAMAFETETAVFIRRELLKKPDLYQSVFGHNKIPTIAQYDPRFISFEEVNEQLLISSPSIMPFVRYQIGDRGGILYLDELLKKFEEFGVDIKTKASKLGLKLFNLPFVYIYERADMSTTLYGLQVYPQTIRIALEDERIHEYLTGKFAMSTVYNSKNDQYLEINVELRKNIRSSAKLKKLIEQIVDDCLLSHNSEFRELTRMLSLKRTQPKIKLWKNSHQQFFMPGRKQKWTV